MRPCSFSLYSVRRRTPGVKSELAQLSNGDEVFEPTANMIVKSTELGRQARLTARPSIAPRFHVTTRPRPASLHIIISSSSMQAVSAVRVMLATGKEDDCSSSYVAVCMGHN